MNTPSECSRYLGRRRIIGDVRETLRERVCVVELNRHFSVETYADVDLVALRWKHCGRRLPGEGGRECVAGRVHNTVAYKAAPLRSLKNIRCYT
jgi:hypothetical protein